MHEIAIANKLNNIDKINDWLVYWWKIEKINIKIGKCIIYKV